VDTVLLFTSVLYLTLLRNLTFCSALLSWFSQLPVQPNARWGECKTRFLYLGAALNSPVFPLQSNMAAVTIFNWLRILITCSRVQAHPASKWNFAPWIWITRALSGERRNAPALRIRIPSYVLKG